MCAYIEFVINLAKLLSPVLTTTNIFVNKKYRNVFLYLSNKWNEKSILFAKKIKSLDFNENQFISIKSWKKSTKLKNNTCVPLCPSYGVIPKPKYWVRLNLVFQIF